MGRKDVTLHAESHPRTCWFLWVYCQLCSFISHYLTKHQWINVMLWGNADSSQRFHCHPGGLFVCYKQSYFEVSSVNCQSYYSHGNSFLYVPVCVRARLQNINIRNIHSLSLWVWEIISRVQRLQLCIDGVLNVFFFKFHLFKEVYKHLITIYMTSVMD